MGNLDLRISIKPFGYRSPNEKGKAVTYCYNSNILPPFCRNPLDEMEARAYS